MQHLLVVVGDTAAPASNSLGATDVYWTAPVATETGLLRTDGSRMCPDGAALTVFTAVGVGATSITATTDAACLHTQPSCEIAQALFETYVVVRTPSAGASPR